jgi:hypothetical protein
MLRRPRHHALELTQLRRASRSVRHEGPTATAHPLGHGDPYDGRTSLLRTSGSGYDAIDLGSLLRPGAPEAGWVLSSASRINDRGEILGIARNVAWCVSCCSYSFVLSHSSLPDEYPRSPPP